MRSTTVIFYHIVGFNHGKKHSIKNDYITIHCAAGPVLLIFCRLGAWVFQQQCLCSCVKHASSMPLHSLLPYCLGYEELRCSMLIVLLPFAGVCGARRQSSCTSPASRSLCQGTRVPGLYLIRVPLYIVHNGLLCEKSNKHLVRWHLKRKLPELLYCIQLMYVMHLQSIHISTNSLQ